MAPVRQTNAMTDHERPEWFSRANCRGLDPGLFHPSRGDSPEPAKAVCAGCCVVAECLDYAIANRLHEGIYGGLCARERQRVRRARKSA